MRPKIGAILVAGISVCFGTILSGCSLLFDERELASDYRRSDAGLAPQDADVRSDARADPMTGDVGVPPMTVDASAPVDGAVVIDGGVGPLPCEVADAGCISAGSPGGSSYKTNGEGTIVFDANCGHARALTGFTIAFHLKWRSPVSPISRTILLAQAVPLDGCTPSWSDGWAITLQPDSNEPSLGQVVFTFRSGCEDIISVESRAALASQTWNHIAVRGWPRDVTTLAVELLIDGVLAGDTVVEDRRGEVSSRPEMIIAPQWIPSEAVDFQIDELVIWTEPIEESAFPMSGPATRTSNMAGLWHFDQTDVTQPALDETCRAHGWTGGGMYVNDTPY